MGMRLPERVGEARLTRALVEWGARRIADAADADVAIAGGGPAGLTLAWLLASKGLRVTLVERRLGLGGGMRGGASLIPALLVEDGSPARLLRRLGARLWESGIEGLLLADPVEVSARLAAAAVDAGARVLVGWHVEDLIVRDGRVQGLVIVLAPAVEAGWHVDPIYVEARATVDATGHDGMLLRILEKRIPGSIRVPGMGPMNVAEGERLVVEKTGMVWPGLYAAGMSVAEAYNTPRMGPVFGGMLASAERLAEIILRDLGATG